MMNGAYSIWKLWSRLLFRQRDKLLREEVRKCLTFGSKEAVSDGTANQRASTALGEELCCDGVGPEMVVEGW